MQITIPHSIPGIKAQIFIAGLNQQVIKDQLAAELAMPPCDREVLFYLENDNLDLESLTEIAFEDIIKLDLINSETSRFLASQQLSKVINVGSKIICD